MSENDNTALLRADTPVYTPITARVPIHIRPAVLGDLPFIDKMQKAHSRELGFLPMAALEGKIKLGQVLVAEKSDERRGMSDENTLVTHSSSLIAYLIAADRYQKRDEIGYVTQINVVPEYRRSLVAAQLLQAQFDRSAYGCRLYSCWCAQDLKANEFWEAMGFTAIAFRTGSMTRGKSGQPAVGGGQGRQEKAADPSSFSLPTAHCRLPTSSASRPRVHIFWQKRIRANDTTTQWWYPSQTGGGEIREDRLVFPIVPGVGWRDVGPIVLDSGVPDPMTAVGRDELPPGLADTQSQAGLPPALPGSNDASPKPKTRKRKIAAPATKTILVSPKARGGFWFEEDGVAVEVPLPPEEVATAPKPKKEKPAKAKIDPRLTAMARELRDQWSERPDAVLPQAMGKHDIKRIAVATTIAPATAPLRLDQAA